MLIGLASAVFLLMNGRVAGISGIVAGLLKRPAARWLSDALFVGGLALGPVVFHVLFHAWPVVRLQASTPIMVVAGILVGFGTRLGSGCTSGHGVCGLARLSPRSAIAVVTFLATGVGTVSLMRLLAP